MKVKIPEGQLKKLKEAESEITRLKILQQHILGAVAESLNVPEPWYSTADGHIAHDEPEVTLPPPEPPEH